MNNYAALAPNQIIAGERLYEEAIDLILASAQNELLIFDQDLRQGDFASLKKFEFFQRFLSDNLNSRLTIILQNTAFFQEKCPRLYKLLSIYGHKMMVYETNNTAKHAKDCFILADQQHYIKRIHIDQARFKYAFNDAESVLQLQSRFQDLLEATETTVSVTRLGL
ncbi:MAG TPA: hypothetical protein PKL42_09785 [Methylotenera sp.]|nr:hypothetical protein [Methylotenera sp.]HPV31577.1 hypothetical protein [Methylotenera sp.]